MCVWLHHVFFLSLLIPLFDRQRTPPSTSAPPPNTPPLFAPPAIDRHHGRVCPAGALYGNQLLIFGGMVRAPSPSLLVFLCGAPINF